MSLPRSPTLVAAAENPARKFCVGIRFAGECNVQSASVGVSHAAREYCALPIPKASSYISIVASANNVGVTRALQ
jgi:hypothetical protein